MKRFTRLALGFSKRLENLAAATAIHIAVYNFCRMHGTLKCTPAVAAGVIDQLWDMGDLFDAATEHFERQKRDARLAKLMERLGRGKRNDSTAIPKNRRVDGRQVPPGRPRAGHGLLNAGLCRLAVDDVVDCFRAVHARVAAGGQLDDYNCGERPTCASWRITINPDRLWVRTVTEMVTAILHEVRPRASWQLFHFHRRHRCPRT
jgi:hypothetical protein